MKRSRLIPLTAALLGVALVPVGLYARSLGDSAPLPAEAPAAPTQVVAPASVVASDVPVGSEDFVKKIPVPPPAATASPQPLLPLFSDDPPGPEKTRRPKLSEWNSAPLVRLSRMVDPRCKAKRIREWVEIRCSLWGERGVSLIAGSREGLDIRVDNESNDPAITLEFPVRRGDARVFQIDGQAGKYGTAPEVFISERWAEGEPAPTISLTGA